MKGALGFDPREINAMSLRSADSLLLAALDMMPASAGSTATAARPDAWALPVRFLSLLADAPDLDVMDCGGVPVVRARLADGATVATKRALVVAALPGVPSRLRIRIVARLAQVESQMRARRT